MALKHTPLVTIYCSLNSVFNNNLWDYSLFSLKRTSETKTKQITSCLLVITWLLHSWAHYRCWYYINLWGTGGSFNIPSCIRDWDRALVVMPLSMVSLPLHGCRWREVLFSSMFQQLARCPCSSKKPSTQAHTSKPI